MKNTTLSFLMLFLVTAGAAHAQTAGVVTLRSNSTSATGSLVPVLTWSTNPTATSCRASGGWSGNKSAAGSETLARISANTNYTLTCSWGTGSARVSWVAPTRNTDGTTITDLAGFRVYYGTSNTSFPQSSTVNDMAARSTNIALAAGTWYFKVRVLNAGQVESADSNIASKVVAGATAARTVSITITAPTTPPPPTNPTLKTIETPVYDALLSGNNYVLGRVVGSIPLSKPCNAGFIIGNYTHYGVARSDVQFSQTSSSKWVVARCALR